ncbi:hypothetical protein [Anoxynatronum sibiricum]|uniref:DUF3311 domain-containing protein n=1 Tax=Anoxynatronum sibiricum TaxID=210623 RepID=A0ABU9VP72_9CLOT
MGRRKTGTKSGKILWGLIILGIAAIEFPGILFINRIEPSFLGMPFLYGFVLLVWAYLCVVLWIAYRINWGK